jgi:2-C-methyl-D-erythritol 4-phosphate cytidylyltransferase
MEGEQENIKITYPLDLVLADFILTERKKKGAFNR